jgi:hypothetical protein
MHENSSTIYVTPPDRRGLELLIECGYVSLGIQPPLQYSAPMHYGPDGTYPREIVTYHWTPPAWALAIDGLCHAIAGFVDRTHVASVLNELTSLWRDEYAPPSNGENDDGI